MHIISVIFYLLIYPGIGFTQINLKNGLIAQYSFSDNYNDESGNNLHGRPYNAIFTTDGWATTIVPVT